MVTMGFETEVSPEMPPWQMAGVTPARDASTQLEAEQG